MQCFLSRNTQGAKSTGVNGNDWVSARTSLRDLGLESGAFAGLEDLFLSHIISFCSTILKLQGRSVTDVSTYSPDLEVRVLAMCSTP